LYIGDQVLEGWHNRLKQNVLKDRHEAVDHVVDKLWEEWKHYEVLLTSPNLLEQRVKEAGNEKRWHTSRLTLSDVLHHPTKAIQR
jgi:hypothetical protein